MRERARSRRDVASPAYRAILRRRRARPSSPDTTRSAPRHRVGGHPARRRRWSPRLRRRRRDRPGPHARSTPKAAGSSVTQGVIETRRRCADRGLRRAVTGSRSVSCTAADVVDGEVSAGAPAHRPRRCRTPAGASRGPTPPRTWSTEHSVSCWATPPRRWDRRTHPVGFALTSRAQVRSPSRCSSTSKHMSTRCLIDDLAVHRRGHDASTKLGPSARWRCSVRSTARRARGVRWRLGARAVRWHPCTTHRASWVSSSSCRRAVDRCGSAARRGAGRRGCLPVPGPRAHYW